MSKTFFTENAYNVLGLDSGASEREILKRSREIENLLKIDEVPEYDSDLPSSKDARTEAKVKKAAERLTTPDKKIIETFFWLFIKDNVDEKALKLYKNSDYAGALETLQAKVTASPNSFTAIRNKAVLESLIFTEKAQNKYLDASLKSWQTILDSGKQWTDFKKVYKLNNPDASDALFNSFKKNAKKILSSFYESMSKAEDKPEIYAAFSKRFSTHSDAFDKETLDPLLNELDDCTKRIEKYNITYEENSYQGDKWVSDDSKDILEKIIEESDSITDKIESLGKAVWNSSKVKIVRDKNASALRARAIDIANNSKLIENPEDRKLIDELLEAAYNICSDDSIIEKRIEKDRKDLERIDAIKDYKVRMDKVNDLIRSRRFSMAVVEIDELLSDDRIPEKVKDDLRKIRGKCAEAAKTIGVNRTSPYSHSSANSSYSNRNSGTGGGLAWLWWLIVAIIAGIIWFASHQSNQNKLNETLDVCADKGISSSECKSSQSKNGVTCKSTGLYVECKKK